MATTGSGPVDTGAIVVGTSALFVVLGAFLGWISLPLEDPSRAVAGVDLVEPGHPAFSGIVTVVVAAVVTTLSLVVPDRQVVTVLTAIGGLAIELVAVAFVVVPELALGQSTVASTGISLSNTGPGLWMTLLGGLGILLGGVHSYRR